jgi:hypothetical protein
MWLEKRIFCSDKKKERKKEVCIFVWRIVVAAEKIKGRFVHVMIYGNNYLEHISLCCIISHDVILNVLYPVGHNPLSDRRNRNKLKLKLK